MSFEPIASLSLDGRSQDAPGWWRNGVISQVYVSFQDSDDYHRPDEVHRSFFEFLRAPWDPSSLAQVIGRGLVTVSPGWFVREVRR